ncbi:actin-related protein 2/3 complex subunit 5 [Blastocladiella britannica]|nr:actin-related protein 2/3 complex subunit 5 [Blastocladiella britannica]
MSHRKLDIDALHLDDDDDQLEALAAQVDLPALQSAAQARASDVANALSRGDTAGAIRAALAGEHPYGAASGPTADPKLGAIKDQSTKPVVDALSAARAADIPALVAALSPADLDLLLKYVYRGMASPVGVNCAALLAWHEKITEVAGVGAVLRVIGDGRAI